MVFYEWYVNVGNSDIKSSMVDIFPQLILISAFYFYIVT